VGGGMHKAICGEQILKVTGFFLEEYEFVLFIVL